ncbi:MAG: 3-ketoacyl-ACP reductase, partial [Promethearchaeota archaeon]
MSIKGNCNARKIGLVTGSARGIGFAIGKKLLSEGYDVIFNGVSHSQLPNQKLDQVKSIETALNTKHYYIQADISTVAGRDKLVSFIKDKLGRIDLLVNNSGIAPRIRKDLLDLDLEGYRHLMCVNLEGPFFLTQAIIKFMLFLKTEVKLRDFNPMVINISSISSYVASINRGEYCISKAGISMMTKLFAVRLGNLIPVYEIRPGIIETDMTRPVIKKYQDLIDKGLLIIPRIGKPEDVGKAVAALVKGYFPYSTGNIFDI